MMERMNKGPGHLGRVVTLNRPATVAVAMIGGFTVAVDYICSNIIKIII